VLKLCVNKKALSKCKPMLKMPYFAMLNYYIILKSDSSLILTDT